MNLQSPKVTVPKSAQDLFNSLSDINNFKRLMPESTVKFEIIGEDSFAFALQGMPEIKLKITEKNSPNRVVFGAASDKLPFTLTADIQEASESTSDIQLHFEGSFNPMMAMMVKGPISKFIETLANNMDKL